LEHIGPAILHGAVTTFLVFFVLIFGRSLNAFFAVRIKAASKKTFVKILKIIFLN